MLGAMFLRGFREVIGVAVVIVGVYLVLNLIVIGSGLVSRRTSRAGSTRGMRIVTGWKLVRGTLRAADGRLWRSPACCSSPSWRWV